MIEEETNLGFKTPNEFCIHIESLKLSHGFDTYIETVVWYTENESDMEIEDLAKFFNKKLRDSIAYEAQTLNLLKTKETLVSLF